MLDSRHVANRRVARGDAKLGALGEVTVAEANLASALDAAAGGDKEQRVFLRADKAVDYGELMQTMNRLRAAGYLKVALVGLEAQPSQ